MSFLNVELFKQELNTNVQIFYIAEYIMTDIVCIVCFDFFLPLKVYDWTDIQEIFKKQYYQIYTTQIVIQIKLDP